MYWDVPSRIKKFNLSVKSYNLWLIIIWMGNRYPLENILNLLKLGVIML